MRSAPALLILLSLAHAVLYCSVLPLWEGFDEPTHYGYVESLSLNHALPVVNRTSVSAEIRESLRLTPVSWLLHNALPDSISFQNWFALSAAERRSRLEILARLPAELRSRPSDLLNYEAQQAPLAYLLPAAADSALSGLRLRQRVFALRLIAALLSAVLLLWGSNMLLRALTVNGPFRIGALACIFESQMLWATVAHVDNDWLAVPLGVFYFALLVMAARNSRPRYVLLLAAVLASGLLTKAYFLAFVPVAAAWTGIRLFRRQIDLRTAVGAAGIVLLAAPWYMRNVVLYGSLSGTQESIAGIGLARAAAAFPHVPWISGTIDLFRWALWTGNWSFVSFSRLTLDIELALLATAFVLLFARARETTAGERWCVASCCAFFLGLVYQTCVTWLATNGRAQHAEPWYVQCIFPCLCGLAFLACQRSGRIGRFLAVAILLVSAWVAGATYLFKLIPLYGGFAGRSTISAVFKWWRSMPLETLSQTVLGPLSALFAALGVFLFALALLNIVLVHALLTRAARVSRIPL